MKKNILVLCPTLRDKRELIKDRFQDQYTIHFDPISNNSAIYPNIKEKVLFSTMLDTIIRKYQKADIHGIIGSSDYPACILSSLLTQRYGIPGATIEHIIGIQHKYYSRLDQNKYVPEVTPQFYLWEEKKRNFLENRILFPCFIKPVRASLSINACIIHSFEELQKKIPHLFISEEYLSFFNDTMKMHTPFSINACSLIIEELLSGLQCTVEGFVQNNTVSFLGITDSIMYPGTNSFQSFIYPSSLSSEVQKRIFYFSKKIISEIGLNNCMFNIEFIYNPDTDRLSIIEINPRIASQFACLYEKVDGTNGYEVALDVACGKQPMFKKGKGSFNIAASYVFRVFENKKVRSLPSKKNREKILALFPDASIELYGQPNKYLAEQPQDFESYRYAIINLGAQSIQDLNERIKMCKKLLKFSFLRMH